MVTTKLVKTPGRPRCFDVEQAIATAQVMFHKQGYDGLSVAELTKILGINPPSFYAAFGSKAALYDQVLKRYSTLDSIPLSRLLNSTGSVKQSLTAILHDAAQRYVVDADMTGCLVIEGTRNQDLHARSSACELQKSAEHMIHQYLTQHCPSQAQALTDFISITLTGLSAKARMGYSLERLLSVVLIASEALPTMLAPSEQI